MTDTSDVIWLNSNQVVGSSNLSGRAISRAMWSVGAGVYLAVTLNDVTTVSGKSARNLILRNLFESHQYFAETAQGRLKILDDLLGGREEICFGHSGLIFAIH